MKTIIISYLFIFFSCSLPSPGEKTFELGLLNSVNILNTKGSCKNTGTRKFTAGKDMNVARYGFTAVNLSNGKILIIGGFTAVNGQYATSSKAEIYDPVSDSFSLISDMKASRAQGTATLLQNGKVLIAGGAFSSSGTGSSANVLNTAELFDPETNTFSLTENMTTVRMNHTATLLPNGKTLIIGGYSGGYLNTAEIFDPVTGKFSSISGNMITSRAGHTSIFLKSGKIIIIGGVYPESKNTELYDYSTGSFTATGDRINSFQSFNAMILSNGKVLITGSPSGQANRTSEIYDPDSGKFSAYKVMQNDALFTNAVTLKDGNILFPGGSIYYSSFNNTIGQTAEIYDVKTESFISVGSMVVPRSLHSANLLPSCRVIILGGSTGTNALNSTEIYDP